MSGKSVRMGVARPSRQMAGSSSRSTVAAVTLIGLTVLFGSFLFVKSPRGLQTAFGGTIFQLRFDDQQHMARNSKGLDLYTSESPLEVGSTDNNAADPIMSSESKLVRYPAYCNKRTALLKVYMYALPPEFHFGMIEKAYGDHIWPQNISQLPRYPGGLNSQHSPEYWLTLDLLASAVSERNYPCAAMLVENPKEADVFFVPYFSSLSYNKYTRSDSTDGVDKNVELQEKLVRILLQQNAWCRSGGKNHVILMHHPNSLHVAREQLRNAMFIVADFGRYSPQVANVDKDIVAPYRHMVPTFKGDNSTFESRKTLLFFQGVIVRKEGGIIRQQLYEMLKDEPAVHFSTGTAQRDGIRSASRGMRSSKYCLHLAGDTPSSNRLFDAIVSHCVPVIISDEIELPYEDELDYSGFCIFVRSTDAVQSGFLMDLLQSVKEQEWTRMWNRLKRLDEHFEYQFPAKQNDAVNMIWKSIAGRVPSVKQSLHKAKRYSRSRLANKAS